MDIENYPSRVEQELKEKLRQAQQLSKNIRKAYDDVATKDRSAQDASKQAFKKNEESLRKVQDLEALLAQERSANQTQLGELESGLTRPLQEAQHNVTEAPGALRSKCEDKKSLQMKCEDLSNQVKTQENALCAVETWNCQLQDQIVMHDVSFNNATQQLNKKHKTGNEFSNEGEEADDQTNDTKIGTTGELLALSRALQIPT